MPSPRRTDSAGSSLSPSPWVPNPASKNAQPLESHKSDQIHTRSDTEVPSPTRDLSKVCCRTGPGPRTPSCAAANCLGQTCRSHQQEQQFGFPQFGRIVARSQQKILMRSRSPKRTDPRCRVLQSAIEPLESRLLFYALAGSQWANPNLSASFVPDGTLLDGGYTSALFAHLDAQHATAVWQREFARALQTWAHYAPLNFHFVADDGSAQASNGLAQT